MRRALFIVEVRFEAERRWRAHQRFSYLPYAMDAARELVVLMNRHQFVFPHVRIRYRGLTLALWSKGGFVR